MTTAGRPSPGSTPQGLSLPHYERHESPVLQQRPCSQAATRGRKCVRICDAEARMWRIVSNGGEWSLTIGHARSSHRCCLGPEKICKSTRRRSPSPVPIFHTTALELSVITVHHRDDFIQIAVLHRVLVPSHSAVNNATDIYLDAHSKRRTRLMKHHEPFLLSQTLARIPPLTHHEFEFKFKCVQFLPPSMTSCQRPSERSSDSSLQKIVDSTVDVHSGTSILHFAFLRAALCRRLKPWRLVTVRYLLTDRGET